METTLQDIERWIKNGQQDKAKYILIIKNKSYVYPIYVLPDKDLRIVYNQHYPPYNPETKVLVYKFDQTLKNTLMFDLLGIKSTDATSEHSNLSPLHQIVKQVNNSSLQNNTITLQLLQYYYMYYWNSDIWDEDDIKNWVKDVLHSKKGNLFIAKASLYNRNSFEEHCFDLSLKIDHS